MHKFKALPKLRCSLKKHGSSNQVTMYRRQRRKVSFNSMLSCQSWFLLMRTTLSSQGWISLLIHQKLELNMVIACQVSQEHLLLLSKYECYSKIPLKLRVSSILLLNTPERLQECFYWQTNVTDQQKDVWTWIVLKTAKSKREEYSTLILQMELLNLTEISALVRQEQQRFDKNMDSSSHSDVLQPPTQELAVTQRCHFTRPLIKLILESFTWGVLKLYFSPGRRDESICCHW